MHIIYIILNILLSYFYYLYYIYLCREKKKWDNGLKKSGSLNTNQGLTMKREK